MKKILCNKKIIILSIIIVLSIVVLSLFLINKEEVTEITYNSEGTYNSSKEYETVMITSENVNLSNITTKNLIITKEALKGDISLENITITGKLDD